MRSIDDRLIKTIWFAQTLPYPANHERRLSRFHHLLRLKHRCSGTLRSSNNRDVRPRRLARLAHPHRERSTCSCEQFLNLNGFATRPRQGCPICCIVQYRRLNELGRGCRSGSASATTAPPRSRAQARDAGPRRDQLKCKGIELINESRRMVRPKRSSTAHHPTSRCGGVTAASGRTQNRTPRFGEPMNSIPAFSRACRIFSTVSKLASIRPSERSSRRMVERANPVSRAS
jgi:hypothetical protein